MTDTQEPAGGAYDAWIIDGTRNGDNTNFRSRQKAGFIAGYRAALSTLSPQGSWQPISTALAQIDAAWEACPVRTSRKILSTCPKCGATDREPCGPNVMGLVALEAAARAAVAPNPPLGPEEE